MEANWLLISAHPSPVDTNRCTVDFVDGVLEVLTGKNVFSTLWSHTAANVGFFLTELPCQKLMAEDPNP